MKVLVFAFFCSLLFLTACLTGCSDCAGGCPGEVVFPAASPAPPALSVTPPASPTPTPHRAINITVIDTMGGCPFVGAEVLLEGASGDRYRAVAEGQKIYFEDIPYGEYKVSIPGYSADSYLITVDASYHSESLAFSRIDVDIVFEVIDEDCCMWVCLTGCTTDYGEVMFSESELGLTGEGETCQIFRAVMPAGRYYIAVEDAVYYGTADISAANHTFSLRRQDMEYAAYFYVPSSTRRIEALMNGRSPDYAAYLERDKQFAFLFLTDTPGEAEFTAKADGFEEYAAPFDVEYPGWNEFEVLLTPEGADETVAVVTVNFSIAGSDEWEMPEGLVLKPVLSDSVDGSGTLNDLLPDFVGYVPSTRGTDNPASYGASYTALYYLDASEYRSSVFLSLPSLEITFDSLYPSVFGPVENLPETLVGRSVFDNMFYVILQE